MRYAVECSPKTIGLTKEGVFFQGALQVWWEPIFVFVLLEVNWQNFNNLI